MDVLLLMVKFYAIYIIFPGSSEVKASAGNAGDLGSIPGLGRSGEGNGNPLQCSCLGIGGFHGGSDGKESASTAGDPGSIPGSGRSPGEGNGNPLQYPFF